MAINKPKLKTMNSKLIYAILILALSSCSLQKRLYTKGFYASKKQSAKKTVKIDSTTAIAANLKFTEVKTKNKNATLTATNAVDKPSNFLALPKKLMGGCDTIVLRSGAKIIANISEFNPTHIKFKNCGSTNEPDITINKDDVNYVVLANGTKEVFDSQKKYNQPNNSNNLDRTYQPQNTYNNPRGRNIDNKKQNGFSIAGFILAIMSHPVAAISGILYLAVRPIDTLPYFLIPFILATLAFIFCVIAIYQISTDIENQQGLIIAIIGACLSLLLMIILILSFIGI
ncbi:MAG TPA: hypothetical protein VK835_04570 [Bacteroidia bacterium]|jgi:hypothetical protein|nr:hypothetical protein [Bacteroidia bacterium]